VSRITGTPHRVKQMLASADKIHRTVIKGQGALGSTESYKERYYKDMAKKYGVS
jgi:hypothetical protein